MGTFWEIALEDGDNYMSDIDALQVETALRYANILKGVL